MLNLEEEFCYCEMALSFCVGYCELSQSCGPECADGRQYAVQREQSQMLGKGYLVMSL